jgi:hypothetical protein
MYKLNNISVKGYDFTATIEDSQLSDETLSKLGLTRDSEYINEIEVIGTYTVSGVMSEDAEVYIDDISLIGTKTGKTFRGPLGYRVNHCEILPTGHPRQGMLISVPQWGDVPIYNTIDLTVDDIDSDSLIDEILDQGDHCQWLEDENASLCDYYYDTYMDR